jgi:hypothetical protein
MKGQRFFRRGILIAAVLAAISEARNLASSNGLPVGDET